MTNDTISSDTVIAQERLTAIERDSKWQNLFTKLAFSAMLAVGISYIAVTAIIIFQMSDLNVSLSKLAESVAQLQLGQSELRADVAVLKTDVAVLKTDMVEVKSHLNIN